VRRVQEPAGWSNTTNRLARGSAVHQGRDLLAMPFDRIESFNPAEMEA
jgi:hypothetical protein